ncbi:hypothetical protein [Siphonobacter sp. BAB-5405]|uniref:hypothetical protein n=1 Tax=Siphonobacter sp. BAB-5405 TaxID=1864825 RepID=UPI0018ECAC36|nr:hypothetical protein [Siphonobacter sp. BAB-5405]
METVTEVHEKSHPKAAWSLITLEVTNFASYNSDKPERRLTVVKVLGMPIFSKWKTTKRFPSLLD